MNVIELAKECGAVDFSQPVPTLLFTHRALEAFATAIIEKFKAGLLPVAYFLRESYDGTDEYNQTDPTVNKAIPLYSLGEMK